MRKIDAYLGLLYYAYARAKIETLDLEILQRLGVINEIDAKERFYKRYGMEKE